MPFGRIRRINVIANENLNNVNLSTKKKEVGSIVLERYETKNDEKQIINISQKNASMFRLWQEFRENTTLHGLKNAKIENKYHLRWVVWIFALVGMGALLVYNVYGLYIYYKTNPTITNINVQFVQEMSYPAITICNLSPYKKTAVNATPALALHLLHNGRLGTILPTLNYSYPEFAELHKAIPEDWLSKVSFDLNDMFKYCVNQGLLVSCTDILSKKITQWGTCFTSRVNGSMTGSAKALTFYIDIKQKEEYVYNANMAAGVKIVLHDPDEDPDISNKGFILSPGFSTYVSMKMTKYKYLPEPYKAAGDQYCVDTKAPEYKNPLKYYPVYSSTGCILECRRNFIVGTCGCRAPTDPGNETLCSHAVLALCYNQHEVEFDSSAEMKEQCQCMVSCEFTSFDQSISTAKFPADIYIPALNSMGFEYFKENGIEVRLYYDSLSYLYVESIPEYSTEDIVGHDLVISLGLSPPAEALIMYVTVSIKGILGGQMGIFLGASLLTVSELLEFVILIVILFVKRCVCSLCTKTDVRKELKSSRTAE